MEEGSFRLKKVIGRRPKLAIRPGGNSAREERARSPRRGERGKWGDQENAGRMGIEGTLECHREKGGGEKKRRAEKPRSREEGKRRE